MAIIFSKITLRADELETKCGKYILLKVGEVEKAEKVLLDREISSYSILENGNIKITEAVEDTSELIAALVKAKARVYELSTVQSTLEEYYFNRTGGEA